MKPATRNLLILGVCIVVLGGALAALMLTGGETDASTTSSSQDIALLNREEADVASIEVTNTSGVFTIVPAEEQPESSAAGSSALEEASSDASGATSSDAEEEINFSIQELEGLRRTATRSTAPQKAAGSSLPPKNWYGKQPCGFRPFHPAGDGQGYLSKWGYLCL